MQQQITHIHSDENVLLHEQIMSITRKGMHVSCFDPALSLKERWLYSQKLAERLNKDTASDTSALQTDVNAYFGMLDQKKLTEAELFWFGIEQNWRLKTFVKMILQLPFFIAGIIQVALPYLVIKRFVERKFERRVFWSSVKMGMLLIVLPIWNFVLLLAACSFFEISWWHWLIYYTILHFVALGFYLFLKNTTLFFKSLRNNAQSLHSIVETRKQLLQKLKTLQF